jgi:hypothetical protein
MAFQSVSYSTIILTSAGVNLESGRIEWWDIIFKFQVLIFMKKLNNHMLVLTLYTKRLGIAVFLRGELHQLSVKTFPLPRTVLSISSSARIWLEALCEEFSPDLVILKTLSKRQVNSAKHHGALTAIRQMTASRNIKTIDISLDAARGSLVQSSHPTLSDPIAILSIYYPELRRYSQIRSRDQREYFAPILSAVAIGHFHTQERLKSAI